MKTGIIMIVIGLLIAGTGAYFWMNYEPAILGFRTEEAQRYVSMGLAAMIVGGGLSIGGLVMILLKR